MAAITPTIASLELGATILVDSRTTTDATIQAWLDTLTITHIYGFTVVYISNTKVKLLLLYD